MFNGVALFRTLLKEVQRLQKCNKILAFQAGRLAVFCITSILCFCFRLGDLLCCETCSAVYHLGCVDPPLTEVPEDDWHCNICVAHEVRLQRAQPALCDHLS